MPWSSIPRVDWAEMSKRVRLSKTLNSALTSLASGLQTGRRSNQNVQRRVRRNRPRRRWRYPPPDYVRSIPSAYVKTPVAKFSARSVENGILVNGADLVQEIPTTISPLKDSIFAIIPSNPLYWIGTRLSSIANMYQNYRPLRFQVHYIPQVSVAQPGTVVMGTLWDNTSSKGNLQKTLVTSNGGLTCPCYSPATTNVRLATNLSMNLYRVHETGTYDSVPFNFLAMMAGGNVVPGYFFVTYSYVFKNAMGSSWVSNTYTTTISDLPVSNSDGSYAPTRKLGQNASLMTLEPTVNSKGKAVPAGTTYAIESVAAGVGALAGGVATHVLKDNGSEERIPADTPVQVNETSPDDSHDSEKRMFSMSLQLASHVPNTTGPTTILPSDILSSVNWVGIGSLINPKLIDGESTFVYGRPALVGENYKQVDIQVNINTCRFAVIVPVKAGGSARRPEDPTFVSTFENDTLVCLEAYKPEGSWETIGSVIVPKEQIGFPILLVSKLSPDATKENIWTRFGSAPEFSNFTNLVNSNTALHTMDLSDFDTSLALNSLMPQEVIDFKTGTTCPWLRLNVTTYVPPSTTSLFKSDVGVPEAASSSDF